MTGKNKANRSHGRFVLYLLSFLFTLHYTLPVYVNSSFLSQTIGEKYIGFVYAGASLITILAFFFIPKILEKIGNYHTTIILLTIELAALLGLSFSHSAWFLIVLFIASFSAVALINFTMDIFLENFSSESMEGKVRGVFLTSGNVAWIIAPLITSFILVDSQYWQVFIGAAFLILPVVILLNMNLRHFQDPHYRDLPLWETAKDIWKDKNIFGGFMVAFLMQLFFSWMVIYTPIYLHDYIGFDWNHIGIIFSIMLIPFVLIEIPLGRLADQRWGEKEILSIGFIIVAISTSLIAFIENKNFIVWTLLLFITRVGASMLEVGIETYFFKKIGGTSLDFISFFRTMRPMAYLIGPLLATIVFALLNTFQFGFKYIFLVLGIIMFYGLRWSLALKDTK